MSRYPNIRLSLVLQANVRRIGHESCPRPNSHLPDGWLKFPPIGTLLQYCNFNFLLAAIPIALCPVVESVEVEGSY